MLIDYLTIEVDTAEQLQDVLTALKGRLGDPATIPEPTVYYTTDAAAQAAALGRAYLAAENVRLTKERDAAIGDTAQARVELTEARQEQVIFIRERDDARRLLGEAERAVIQLTEARNQTGAARDEARRNYERIAAHRDELIDQNTTLKASLETEEAEREILGETLRAITVAFAKAQNLDSRQIAAIEAAENLLTHSHTVA